MVVKLSYTDGETVQKLKNLLLAKEAKFETRTVGGTDYSIVQLIITGNEKSPANMEINEPQAIKLAYSKADSHKIYKLNQIGYASASSNPSNYVSEYKITLVDLRVAKFSKREIVNGSPSPSGWNKLRVDEEDKEIKKILLVARKAVQCLGLDFAMIHMALNKLHRPIVLNIDPSPNLSEKSQKNLIAYLTGLLDKTFNHDKIKIGADPEFMMINKDTGKMVVSSQFFPRFGPVGCDSVRISNRQQRPIAEVRPDPDYNPLKVIDNLHKVLLSAIKLVPYRNIEWLAGSQPIKGYPIGGHIHFGNIQPNSKLLRALDNYLAIPLMLMEKPESSVRRRQKYGHLSDYRIKDHGGFEYRTVGSWLISPDIARGVLCLARLIVNNYENLTSNYFISPESQEAFYQSDKDYFRNIYDQIWETIRRLPEAEEFMPHLEAIDKLCKTMTDWDERQDIRSAWGIPIPKKKFRAEHVPVKTPATTRSNLRTNVRVR